jgi:hypothetical protein
VALGTNRNEYQKRVKAVRVKAVHRADNLATFIYRNPGALGACIEIALPSFIV